MFYNNNTTNKVLLACRRIFVRVKKTLQRAPALGRRCKATSGQQSAGWRSFCSAWLEITKNKKLSKPGWWGVERDFLAASIPLSIWLLREAEEWQVAPSSVTVMCTPQVSRPSIFGPSNTLVLGPGSQTLVPEPWQLSLPLLFLFCMRYQFQLQ